MVFGRFSDDGAERWFGIHLAMIPVETPTRMRIMVTSTPEGEGGAKSTVEATIGSLVRVSIR